MNQDGLKVSTDKVILVPATAGHMDWLRIQRNKPELMKYFRQNDYISYNDQMNWFSSLNKKNVRLFIVILEGTGVWLGYVGFNPIDWRHKHAEFGIFIVPEHQGKGYAVLALKELLRIGFEDLNLEKIYSDVLNYPEETRFSFYQKLGFKKEGVLRRHYFKNERWIDAIQFSMLKEEWKGRDDKENQDRLEVREQESTSAELV